MEGVVWFRKSTAMDHNFQVRASFLENLSLSLACQVKTVTEKPSASHLGHYLVGGIIVRGVDLLD
jgi:hypothetical protein